MPFFSIIIPVYNVEKYLHRCIKSILNQKFDDYEIILIDDGSKDNSIEICRKYAEVNNNITLITKKNGGAASARNEGIQKSRGNYLLFVDSDDYWNGEFSIRRLAEKLESTNTDICLYGCYDEWFNTKKRVLSRGNYSSFLKDGNTEAILNTLIRVDQFPGSCWIFAVKREFIISNHIQFPEKNRTEDIEWIVSIFSKLPSISWIDDCFYIYSKNREESVTGTAGIDTILSILKTVKKWSSELKNKKYEAIYLPLNSYLIFEYFTALIFYARLGKFEKKKAKAYFEMMFKLDI